MSGANQEGAGLLPESQSTKNNPFNLFSGPDIETNISGSETHCFGPFNSLQNNSNFVFNLPSFEDCLYLPSIRLYGKIRIMSIGENGELKAPAAAEDFSVVNLLPSALFSRVSVKLNNQEISKIGHNCYPFKAYLETLLSFDSGAKESYLKTSMWHPDDVKTAKSFKTTAAGKSGYDSRKGIVSGGKEIFFSTMIHSDIFQQEKYLIPGVSIQLEFDKSDESFFLLAEEKYKNKLKVQFLSLQIYCTTVQVTDVVKDQLTSTMVSKPALYPMISTGISLSSIPQGTKQITLTGLHVGILPNLVLGMFIDSKALSGSMELNPFYFNNVDVEGLQFFVSGTPVPSKRFEMNYAKGDFLRIYDEMIKNLRLNTQNTIAITPEEFKEMYNIYVIDLSNCIGCGNTNHKHVASEKKGSLSCDIVFKTNTDKSLHFLCYTTNNKRLTIDTVGSVSLDY